MDREPVAILLAGFAAVFSLCILAANAMDWTHLEADEVTAVVAAVAGICVLVGSAIRATVFSPATHNASLQRVAGSVALFDAEDEVED